MIEFVCIFAQIHTFDARSLVMPAILHTAQAKEGEEEKTVNHMRKSVIRLLNERRNESPVV